MIVEPKGSARTRTLLRSFFALTFLAILAWGVSVIRNGFSAREQPSALEAAMATRLRSLAIPSSARNAKNPVPETPEVLTEARRHFADHCAVCHANDGGGNTPIGQNLYPKAPDMRLSQTQQMTDGEIYYIIRNGVRLTGMPAWGPPDGPDEDSWKLVHFIRHLPKLTADELKDMEVYNPRSDADRQEDKNEEDFLNGQPAKESEHQH
jgi:mono/diheme cytochrome c family protein